MARPLRIEYEGACYHLLSRGDRREPIFRDDEDRRRFLESLGEAGEKTGWQVHAFCLMSNHFHLVVETPRANLCAGMKWLLGTVTVRFNRRHKLSGHLFAGRYKSLIIDERSPAYLRAVCDYVHLNPGRAGLLAPEQGLETFPWSSLQHYVGAPGTRPSWLRVDRLLAEHGVRHDDRRGRLQFARRMEETRLLERQALPDNVALILAMRKGWHLGAEDFLARLFDELARRGLDGEAKPGSKQERATNEQQKSQKIIAQMLLEAGWSEEVLLAERKGHPLKVKIARALRAQSTLTQQQIAERLRMGTRTHLNHLLYQSLQRHGTSPSSSR